MKSKYTTEQRILLEKYFMDNEDKFVSSKDILEYMKDNDCKIGLTTIYRFLKLLEEENKVRTEVKDHTKYYQYINANCCNHFHLKCKKCGKIQHLDCEEFEQVTKHIKEEHHFALDYNTIIYGICEKCLK